MPAQSRTSAFDAYLRANAIPIDGLSVSSNPPGPTTVTIQFQASATAEQIAWANDALASFDWRPRRFLAESVIASTIAGLTTAQQNAVYRRLAALFIMQNEAWVRQVMADQGISIPYDEVAP